MNRLFKFYKKAEIKYIIYDIGGEIMNKKLNTFFFVILATVFNIVIIMILMFVFFIIISKLPKTTPDFMAKIIITVLFIGALVAAFFIYHIIISALDKKFDLEKYILPVFRTKKKKDSDSDKMMY
jgi:hypothetical protein